eukprot:TRINITY_DN8964_c1_g3_i1.p1 TRINITY_DN8964_c1_g3~~TRINITY_DN8964_c1_g3_i1.p1  ORF type:complete len:383 (+),score=78.59 TRINITY_DN8964_c1_g3_i1:73-1149(+)
MLTCCLQNPSVMKGTQTMLSRTEFSNPDIRDLGEKDLDVDLTYETLRIVADPTRIFDIKQWVGNLHMYEMWEATDVRDGKRVLVKTIVKDTQNGEKCLRQEDAVSAQTVYNLDTNASPFIASVYGLFEQYPVRCGLNFWGTKIWLVQEYPGGTSLLDWLIHKHPHQEHTRVSSGVGNERTIAKILRQVLSGVREAHAAHTVLRNVCTANVFISSSESVKIHDFWYTVELPETSDPSHACFHSTVWAGYPSCLSPESLIGTYYQAGDIWSCGVMALELGMGVNPFTAIAVDCLQEGISLTVANKLRKCISEAAANLEILPRGGVEWSQNYKAFTKMMLHPNHTLRPTATELLQHPFLKQ